MGWTSNTLNELSEMFVEECGPGKVTLDVGAALGVATIPALKRGARVYANDLSGEHLEELAGRVSAAERERLVLLSGRFPRDIDMKAETLDGMHASSVLHFMTGRQLELTAAFAEHALKPGGRLYVLAATPWMQPFASFAEQYEERVRAGDRWPGWIENVRQVSQHRLLSQMPKSVHLLDGGVLERVFGEVGLVTEKCWLLRRRDLPRNLYLDGRENVAYIARKI